MRPCKPERGITCPFKKKGDSWSTGEHSGIDWGTPGGDPVYAMWGGKVTGNSWGSAYGTHIVIDHDHLPNGDPGLWAIYAHLKSKTVGSGDRVEAGDLIGYADNTGNSSGNHLHTEIQPQSTWVKGSYRDPQPWVDAGGTSSGGGGGPYETEHVYRSKCGYGEPSNGDSSSDTVKELQNRLNNISLEGGQELDITGVYDDDTDDEVRKWQEQICGDPPDPVHGSYLGPAQFKAMFPDSIYTLHDDGDAAIASGGGSSEGGGSSDEGTTLGQWLISQGFAVNDDNVPYGRDSTWNGVDFLLVHHTVSPDDGAESDIANYIKNGGSGTYPPLAQIMLGQSGTAWMTSKQREGQAEPGRASQAGNGDGYGVPDDSMNAYSLGIECQADGKSPLSDYPTMYNALIELLALLTKRYGVPTDNIIGHKEWSNTGKTDPLDDMDVIRADVANFLAGGPPQPPSNEIPPGDVYVSKLHKGQTDSDSVKRLQQTLNATTLGGTQSAKGFEVVLEVNGTYDDLTNEVVQTWQAIEGYPVTENIPVDQANIIFAGSGNTVIDDTEAPPEPTPPEPEVVTVNGGHCHDIQAGMDEAASKGASLRLTGTFYTYTNVYIPDDLYVDATGAKFYVNSESAADKATYNAGRFRNATNSDAPGYGQAGWFTWDGGEFDGNGEGIMTFSHSPGYTVKNAKFYNYCSEGNTGHAIEINSSGGEDNHTGPFNVKILTNTFLGTNRGQRDNSNDEPVHWDWNWDGSGGAAPVWHKGDPVNEDTQVMCHNVLVEGNTFHRKSESGGWEFALTAIGGHDASDEAFDPEYRHNHVLVKGNTIHGAKGSTSVSPNKGAIHLSWTRDAKVEGNKLYGGVSKRYVTAENQKDSTYCTASGNTSDNPDLSNENSIVVEG